MSQRGTFQGYCSWVMILKHNSKMLNFSISHDHAVVFFATKSWVVAECRFLNDHVVTIGPNIACLLCKPNPMILIHIYERPRISWKHCIKISNYKWIAVSEPIGQELVCWLPIYFNFYVDSISVITKPTDIVLLPEVNGTFLIVGGSC